MAEAAKSESKEVRVLAPVPRAVAEWVRKSDFHRTLNDLVEDAHLALIEKNAEYARFLDAVHDEQAQEGSLAVDNALAAQIIRDHAKKTNVPRIGEAKLATIVKCLNVVMRRYGVSRQERRHMIHGEIVSTGNGD